MYKKLLMIFHSINIHTMFKCILLEEMTFLAYTIKRIWQT